MPSLTLNVVLPVTVFTALSLAVLVAGAMTSHMLDNPSSFLTMASSGSGSGLGLRETSAIGSSFQRAQLSESVTPAPRPPSFIGTTSYTSATYSVTTTGFLSAPTDLDGPLGLSGVQILKRSDVAESSSPMLIPPPELITPVYTPTRTFPPLASTNTTGISISVVVNNGENTTTTSVLIINDTTTTVNENNVPTELAGPLCAVLLPDSACSSIASAASSSPTPGVDSGTPVDANNTSLPVQTPGPIRH